MKKYFRTTPKQRNLALKLANEVLVMMRAKNAPSAKSSNGYVLLSGNIPEKVTRTIDDSGDKINLQTVLPKLQKYCQVCAMGAIYLAKVRLLNNEYVSGECNSNNVSNAFDRSEIFDSIGLENSRLIENAFEGWCGDFQDKDSPYKEASKFWDKYRDPKKRIIAIMKNVIEHNGEFQP